MNDDPAAVHAGRMQLGEAANEGPAAAWPPLRAQLAQYSDCQQLQLWLPAQGGGAWERLQVEQGDGHRLLDVAAADVLQAATRITLDTLHWPPGPLQLRVTHAGGGSLHLALHKAPDQDVPQLPQPAAAADPQDDLRCRDAARRHLAEALSRRVHWVPQGRAGQVVYEEVCDGDVRRLAFDGEIGAGRTPLWVHVPRPADWPRLTGLPRARRDDILAFVATALGRDHAGGCRADIGDDAIVFRPMR